MAKRIDPATGEGQRTRKLTPKQEAFAREYVKCGNASEAYRRAYNCKPGISNDTVKVEASRLMDIPNVALTIRTQQAKAAQKHEITVDRITAMMLAAYDKAMGEGKGASAAVSAGSALAKLHGLITDKVESKTSLTGSMTVTSVDRPPAETREQWIERRKRELAASGSAVAAPARPAN